MVKSEMGRRNFIRKMSSAVLGCGRRALEGPSVRAGRKNVRPGIPHPRKDRLKVTTVGWCDELQ